MANATVEAVVIGRNEGTRLVDCLGSLGPQVRRVVYVDSGSTDGSVAAARAAGATVVELDLSRPFTAARARNAGLAEVLQSSQPPEFIQFVDGDCIVRDAWVARAVAFLSNRPDVALVCGRRRERFPEASIYNLLCDWEWNTPVGPARACGGDVLVRRTAITGIGGYDAAVIAAEDDEMCQRLTADGWRLWRIDAEMTLHDAAIHRFGQWWRRSVRAGHGFAQVGRMHPGHFVAERRRVWVWGGVLPVVAVTGLGVMPAATAGVAMLYALSFGRVAVRFRKGGMARGPAIKAAALITLSKFCNFQGLVTFWWRRLRGSAARIIEYK